MKLLLTLVLAAFLAAPAYAAFQGPGAGGQGGFQGPGSAQAGGMTVAQAKSLPDDARVTLVGSIVRQLNDDDKYMFRDGTGEIVVDIDRKDFRGQTVTPQNTVRIYGEVDRDFGRNMEIDVKSVEIVR